MNVDGAIDLAQVQTPTGPALGTSAVYFKSDGLPYARDTGAEVPAGTRWGFAQAWTPLGLGNIAVTFFDGYPPRVGDLVLSQHPNAVGDVFVVYTVVDSTHADLFPTNMNVRDGSTLDTGWQSGTYLLQNGWTQYASWEPMAYRKKDGIVRLKGLLAPGTTTVGTILLTMPAGYRPGGHSHTPVASGFGAGGGCLNINTNGNFALNYNCTGWISLNNIAYPAEN